MTNADTLPANPHRRAPARSRLTLDARALAGLSLGLALGLGGCSDYSHQIASDIRDNPTPELQTLWERPVDVDNHVALTRNTNFRAMWQDLGRAMLLDRPSPMILEPMPR